MKKKGLIQVYTGDGKGKTTAAVGLACRAVARGLRVCFVHFHKSPDRWGPGEHKILRSLGVKVSGFAGQHPLLHRSVDVEGLRRECLKGLAFVRKLYQEDKYDLLILDELNISLRDGFLKEEEILDILNSKPEGLELVLTGRGVSKRIIRKADLVSEIMNIKHPYNKKTAARRGIEY